MIIYDGPYFPTDIHTIIMGYLDKSPSVHQFGAPGVEQLPSLSQFHRVIHSLSQGPRLAISQGADDEHRVDHTQTAHQVLPTLHLLRLPQQLDKSLYFLLRGLSKHLEGDVFSLYESSLPLTQLYLFECCFLDLLQILLQH